MSNKINPLEDYNLDTSEWLFVKYEEILNKRIKVLSEMMIKLAEKNATFGCIFQCEIRELKDLNNKEAELLSCLGSMDILNN